MWKLKLLQQSQLVPFTHAGGSGAPLAYAIKGQNRRCIEGAGEESARSVALMVVGEQELCMSRGLKLMLKRPAHVQFVLEPDRHRQPKAFETGGSIGQVGFQQAVELRERFVVKCDVAQILML